MSAQTPDPTDRDLSEEPRTEDQPQEAVEPSAPASEAPVEADVQPSAEPEAEAAAPEPPAGEEDPAPAAEVEAGPVEEASEDPTAPDEEPTAEDAAPAPEAVEAPAEPTAEEAPAEPEADETPAEPEAADAPAEPTAEAPAEPTAEDAPGEPAAAEAPAEPEAAEAPAEPTTEEAPAEPEAAEAPAEPVVADAAAAPAAEEAAPADQQAAEGEAQKAKKKKPKPQGPSPQEITRRIGTTSEDAIRYVLKPDPKLSRLARKHREAVIPELSPVTAAALLGPAALARHFIASAAAGRYRDLFNLWTLFRERPEECKPVLAERQRALDTARRKLETSVRLGLTGHAERVAEDVLTAEGLPWKWLRQILDPWLLAAGARPAVAAALMVKEPGIAVPLPEDPPEQWLAEAVRARDRGQEIPQPIAELLGRYADRLPATVTTLQSTHEQHPDRVPALIERIDLDAPDIAAMSAWARDHGYGDRLRDRMVAEISRIGAEDRAEGLARWRRWHDQGIDLPLPDVLTAPTLEGLDLGRPETADLLKVMIDNGAEFDPQQIVDQAARENRMRGEKTFEAFVCVGFDVHLPLVLEGNPMVPKGSRCPACQAWTWVRPGHEQRCPRYDWSIEEQAVSQHGASAPTPAPTETSAPAPAPAPQATAPAAEPEASGASSAPAAGPPPEVGSQPAAPEPAATEPATESADTSA